MRDEFRERLIFKNYKWTAPKYYDHPDGQDLLGKLSFTTKIGFFAGATIGMFIATRMRPIPTTKSGLLLKAISYIPAFVAAPFAFTTVTYAATNYRKKDDQINYVLGSIAAGVVGATLARVPQHTMYLTVVLSAIGFAKKTAQMNGTKLFPPVVKRYEPPYYSRNLDFSFTKVGEPEWTKTLATEK